MRKSGTSLRSDLARALSTLLLLLGTSWTTWAGDAQDQTATTAILLVARPELTDSEFADSVVLVMNNLGPSPIGVIVNKPTPIAVSQLVSELFPDLKRLAPKLHDKIYFGGPVEFGPEFGTVWFLFRAPKPPEHAIQAFAGVCLSSDRQLLRQLLGREKPMDGLRIFVGHSGWAPGQLQAEIAAGAWTLKRADSDAIFNGKSEHPWPPPPQAPKGST